MDAWSLMRGDAFIHFVSGSRRVNIRLGGLLLIPKSPQRYSGLLGMRFYIRLVSKSRHAKIPLRVELIGWPTFCFNPFI